MIYLLYHRGYPTGRNLSEAVSEKLGSRFTPITSLARLRNHQIKAGDSLIRWGSTRRDQKDKVFFRKGGRVLNSAEAIMRNTNKLNSLRVFKNAGLNTPRVYTNKHDIKKFPVLGRDRTHHGGKDIVIIKGSSVLKWNRTSKIPDKDFYSEFLPSKEEYRVHVFNGQVVRVTRKVFRGQTKDGKTVAKEGLIRNDTFGWGHQNVDINNLKENYATAAIKSVEAIGLDFGAVDLLIASKDGLPYILEVNSSPSLNPIGLETYSNSIADTFDVPRKKKKQKRYVWE